MEEGCRDIPIDVMEEILCRLPVKSLLRFRSVSKSWKRKISEVRFIDEHRKQARLPDNLSMKGMVAMDLWSEYLYCRMPFKESNNEKFLVDTGNFKLLRSQLRMGRLFATCDELWVVESWSQFFLWNVSTRTYKKLPDKPPGRIEENPYNFWVGVGYEPIGDDYKVVISPETTVGVDGDARGVETQVYSLINDSWTMAAETFPLVNEIFTPKRQGVCLNGVLHWIVYPFHKVVEPLIWPSFKVYDPYLDYAIVSFDLRSEKYGEVAPPPSTPRMDSGDHVGVAVLKGMLCVFLSYNASHEKLVLWVMKDYNKVGECWSILYEICYHEFPIFVSLTKMQWIPTRNLPTPLYLFDNGDLLICTHDTRTILIYKHHASTPNLRITNVDDLNRGIMHVETLLLLH